jgi:hypothetical protein
MKDQRQFLILLYYELGMTYSDITFTLANRHGIILSVRHLKRILKTIGIGRRNYSKLEEVIIFIVNQLQGSGMMHGYRMMHTKCREFGFNVAKEHVRIILRELDPAGVDRRQARRLVRRRYESDGPNAVWHLDGYDKLKPYGLCVSGCVDGFSRKVIWLNVYCTNSDPRIIGGYYLEAVQKFGGCPKRVRGDFGTENVSVRDLQIFLRRHDEDTTTAYIEGSSTLNQRIESWWGILRRQCVDFWIELFRELHLADNFSGDFLDRNLVQFCFTAAIQVGRYNSLKQTSTHVLCHLGLFPQQTSHHIGFHSFKHTFNTLFYRA